MQESTANYNIRPLQEDALKIFKEFKRICDKHKLKYYAAYGTALGAVRHHGFIPWDDDLDVAMPREDYNKFVKIVRTELPSNMEFSRGGEKPCAPIYFSKIINNTQGLSNRLSDETGLVVEESPFIDIFVLEGVPEYVTEIKRWWRERRLWRLCQLWRYPKSSFCASVRGMKLLFARFLGCLINWKYRETKDNEDMMCVYDELACQWSTSKNVIEPSFFRMKESRILSRSFFEPARELPFEDTHMRVAANVEEILTRYYGDYMQLPPENDRLPPHVMRLNYEGHV